MWIVWLLVGAVAAWSLLKSSQTKSGIRHTAYAELAAFKQAIDAWNQDRDSFDSLTQALHHFAVYDERRADFADDPTGRSIPSHRAVLSSFWVTALKEAGLVDRSGRQSRSSKAAAVFWDSVQSLRDRRDQLLSQDYFAPSGS
jgi:hypothetical protein